MKYLFFSLFLPLSPLLCILFSLASRIELLFSSKRDSGIRARRSLRPTMLDAQKFKGLEDGMKKLESQLLTMAADTTKKFEVLEANQNSLSSQLQ